MKPKDWRWSDFWAIKSTTFGYLTMILAGLAATLYANYSAIQIKNDIVSAQKEQQRIALNQEGLNRLIEIQGKQNSSPIEQNKLLKDAPSLVWLNYFDHIRQALDLKDLTVKLAPHRQFANITPSAQKTKALYETPVDITASIRHEQDLIRLFAFLRNMPHAIVNMDSCSVELKNPSSENRLWMHCQVRFVYLLTNHLE